MELSAIYHRTESEYAYLCKDKKLHIRIRTKKRDIESINLHYGDPFIFMEEFYQDTKKMAKITSDTIPYLKPNQEPCRHQSHEDRAT